jgi:hypothetical protein
MREKVRDSNLDDKVKNKSVVDTWQIILDTVMQATEQCVPKAKPRTRRHYKPLWENPQALAAVKKKKQAWTRYLASEEGMDYIMYLRLKRQEIRPES